MRRCPGQISFLIVALGAVVRLWGIGFGLPYAHSRPDELALAGPAALCLEGHWRPPDFYYPSLYIYALACVYDSHFGTTDVTMTGLIVLTVLLIERWRDDGTVRGAAIAGAVGGLATSVKYNGLGVALPFCMAAVTRALDGSNDWARRVRVTFASAAAFALAMLAAFLLTSPYIVTFGEWDSTKRRVDSHRSAPDFLTCRTGS